ncbi:hypothetical protein PANO111632_02605 [Paracoccus nototheniae]|uniref:Uncharacterized protein n=1 Tax=Paracoccus nototheniae TaxID=2489002 RepID=A0ABW4DV28_9RHOB|nr:hypothetical protein [Paracoccus nototheniae]
MRGAAQRIKRDIEMRNRQAWNTARLTGAAMVGKLPDYEKCFGRGNVKHGKPQPPAVLAAMGRALAAVWGAKMPDQTEGK